MQQRVLLIAPQPFYTVRGTPMNVLQMCRALTHGGYQVDLATYPMGENIELPGLEIHRAPSVPGIRSVPIGFSIRKILLDLALGVRVLELLLRRRYAVVHAVEEAAFMMLPATWFGVKLIYDLDSQLSEQLAYSGAIRNSLILSWVRWVERTTLKRSLAAVTVCESLTDAARALCAETPIYQIEDAPIEEATVRVDASDAARKRDEMGLSQRPIVVYTGNLEAYQGIDLLVEATAALRERVPDAVVVLVGGSPIEVEALRSRVERMGLGEQILAVGSRPPEEMALWMELGDVLVSPRTEGENTPLKLYTYMFSGRPIVATNLTTHTQVLDESNALLCEPTAVALADALARGLSGGDDVVELGRRAQALAETRYSTRAFERRLLDAYAEILASETPITERA